MFAPTIPAVQQVNIVIVKMSVFKVFHAPIMPNVLPVRYVVPMLSVFQLVIATIVPTVLDKIKSAIPIIDARRLAHVLTTLNVKVDSDVIHKPFTVPLHVPMMGDVEPVRNAPTASVPLPPPVLKIPIAEMATFAFRERVHPGSDAMPFLIAQRVKISMLV